jgi:AcrR family transcriptional regulator
MPRAKRRDREIQRTREDILSAAARVFAKVGYAGATMQEIAREAGYTAPSLYTYFDGKDSLMRQLFEGYIAELLELFERPTPRGLNFVQSLELLVHSALELCERRRDVMIAFGNIQSITNGSVGAESDDIEARKASVMVIERFAQWLEATAKKGDLTGIDALEAAHFMYGVFYAFVQRWDQEGRTHRLTDLAPKLLDLFLFGIRGVKG